MAQATGEVGAEPSGRGGATAARLAAMGATALRLSSAPSHEAVAEALLADCVAALGATSGVLAAVGPDGRQVAILGAFGAPQELLAALAPAAGDVTPLADALRQVEPLWLGTRQEVATRYPRLEQALGRGGLAALAITPLRAEGQALGALAIASAAPWPGSTEDRTFLAAMAAQAALAIARLGHQASAAQALATASRATAHTMRVQTLTASLAEAVTPAEVLAIVAAQVGQHIGETSGAIGLVTADGSGLEIAQMVGYDPGDLRPWQRIPMERGQLAADVALSGEAQFYETRGTLVARYPQLAQARLKSAAWAVVPLRTEGRTLGVLSLGFPQARSFAPDERTLLELFAQQCATAVQRTSRFHAVERARATAERAADRVARLYTVTAALAEALTLAEVAEVIVNEGMAALGAIAGSVRQLSPDGGALLALQVAGYPPELVEQWRVIPIDAPMPMAETVRLARSILIESPEEMAASWPQFADAMAALHYKAVALLPLMVGGRPIGTMSLGFARPRRFDADDRSFLDALARQCAFALERARLYAATQAQAARLGALAEASQLFAAASLDLPSVLDAIAWRVAHAVGDMGTVSLLSDDRQLQQVAAIAHTNAEAREVLAQLLSSFPLGADEGISGRTLHTGEAQLIPTISEEQLRELIKPEHWPFLERFGIYSLMVAPLRVNGEVIGTLSALRDRPSRPYTDNDLTMLRELADRAALAVANARLYQQAREAIQIRDQFLSIAAHELKTPLTALSGQAQLVQRRLGRGEQTPERLARSIAVIARQADRLDAMVRTLLDVARIERGQFALERQGLDLLGLVDRVVDDVQGELDSHVLVFERAAGPLMVDGDPLRLEQVIQNLLSNAVKYSPDGGTIMLRVERREGEAVVTVVDEGVGIPAEALPQLFQRFYRAANVTEHHISGMGIGLYVVREIVTRHGGTVEVRSAEGEGSVFTVSLPLVPEAATGGS
ncbi:MAG TPA: GAF domain-containing protein [Chloroflexaceae bacterium]|nr:GAF domain-containing protein [Chloroflexaceae bacterium]